MLATSTSPGCSRPKSAGPASTRAVPVTCPALAPIPRSTGPACSPAEAGSHRANAFSHQLPCGSTCGGVTSRCPRHTARRCATTSLATRDHGRFGEDLGAVQPEHVVRPLDRTGRDQPRAQLAQHPAQLRPGQPDVGQCVFAQRRHRLGPAQQPEERRAAQRVEPGGDLRGGLRRGAAPRAAAARGARCPRRRGRTAASRSAVPGRPPGPGPRSRGCRRCARAGPGAARTGRTTPATSAASTPAGGSSASIAADRAVRRRGRAARRRAPDRPGPGGEVVERLLGADRRAVEPEQERDRGRVARPADEPLVEPRERRLAARRQRDDRLDRGVVGGSCVEQLHRAVEQLGVRHRLDGRAAARSTARTYCGCARSRQRSRRPDRAAPQQSPGTPGPDARVIRAIAARL